MAKENLPLEDDYQPDIIELEDEDGNSCTMEVIDVLDHQGVHYMAVVPYVENEEDIDEEATLIILRVGQDDQGEDRDIVEDDGELLEISNLFQKRLEEVYHIDPSDLQ